MRVFATSPHSFYFYQRLHNPIYLLPKQVTIRWPDQRREERGINLVVYGDTENKMEK